jgi:ParB family transcriptional regulator, chromosome partitioning protein
MEKAAKVRGMDVPIVKLTPIRRRTVTAKGYSKLLANIKAVGLIEPLCVCRDGEQFFILDGYIRYQVLLELGIETVPCLILESKDIYTPNRQVNHLSPHQEIKMLRKALEHMDEKSIAKAFGLEGLGSRLRMRMRHDLHPEVLKALDSEVITQEVAREISYVLHKRQVEILELMREAGDYSLAFVRAQVLRTTPSQRGRKNRRTPWEKHETNKRNLVRKLQEVEKHHDFYSALYRQYVGDLLKLAIHVRQILTRPALRSHLTTNYPDVLELFESLLKESEGKTQAV